MQQADTLTLTTNALRLPDCPMSLQHNGRIMPKRIHVRIEHVKPSRCKEEFLKRSKENDEIKHEAKQRGGEQNLHKMSVCLHTIAVSLAAANLSRAPSASFCSLLYQWQVCNQHSKVQNSSFGSCPPAVTEPQQIVSCRSDACNCQQPLQFFVLF